MKCLLLFFWSGLALADTAPSPTPVDMNALVGMLENGMKIGANLPGVLGAIFVALVAVAIAVILIAQYFVARGQRERDAYNANLAAQQLQNTNLSRMQSDATQALIDNMEIVYKQDFDYFTKQIEAKQYPAIFAKVAPQFHLPIANFLYDESLSAPIRAARIIGVIRSPAQHPGTP